MARLGASATAIFIANLLIALLMGFEASSIRRWTLSRRNGRQLDIVVARNQEAAERRFFDRWTARQRVMNDQTAVDRGAPPPTRDIPGQAVSRPPPLPRNEIIGLFPEPVAPRGALPPPIPAPATSIPLRKPFTPRRRPCTPPA